MSFIDWINRIHEKPHETRRRYMWGAAAAALLVVGFFWVLSLKYELKVVFDEANKRETIEKSLTKEGTQGSPSLGDTLRASVQDFLSIFNPPADKETSGETDKKEPAPNESSDDRQFLPN